MRFFLLHWTCLGWPRMPHYILLLTTLRQNKYSKKRRCLNDLISYACKNNLHKFNLQNNNSNNCWIHHCHAICTDIFMAQTVIEDWGRETARNCTYKRRLYIPPSRQPLPRRNRMCMEHELKWYPYPTSSVPAPCFSWKPSGTAVHLWSDVGGQYSQRVRHPPCLPAWPYPN